MKEFLKRNEDELFRLLEELCKIPAPSGLEDARAEFCRSWLEKCGAEGVYIDEAKNVIFPLNCENKSSLSVFAAHTDTVFPDLEPMPYIDDGERIHCPGVGDDTASLAVLLIIAKYFIENGLKPEHGVLFVANSCEEGLGNLKGTRALFEAYEGRISRFVSFDAVIENIYDTCVGSHRYEVEVKTPGGHSYGKFGNKNAIAELSNIINEIYAIKVPEISGTKTTYNVGTVSGGTSVNTIAQSAKMLCEYRSSDVRCLEIMKAKFFEIFEAAKSEDVNVSVTVVGERPCASESLDLNQIDELCRVIEETVKSKTGNAPARHSASTDSNIPLSLGIPAVTMGVWRGFGAHTREEWIEKSSLPLGLEIGLETVLKLVGEYK